MNEEKQKFIGGIDFDELKAQRVQLYNTITVDLATARANEEMVFTGNYIYALEGTDVDANLDIRFNELFRAAITIKKGRGVRVPFYRFYLTNAAQAGKTLVLAIGIEAADFEVFDVGKALEITGGVRVTQDDSWRYDTGLSQAFIGTVYQAPTVGSYSLTELWNPAASGVVAYVKRVMGMYVDAGTVIMALSEHNAALSTAGESGNKLLGGAAPVCQVLSEQNVAMLGDTLATVHAKAERTPVEMLKDDPIRVGEGAGLIFGMHTLNVTAEVVFEWVEV